MATLFTNVWQAVWGEGFAVRMRRFRTMTVTAIGGLLFVAPGFGHLDSPRAPGGVGVTLIIYAVLALAECRPKASPTERWANPLVGLSSGPVAGFTGVAAVPLRPTCSRTISCRRSASSSCSSSRP